MPIPEWLLILVVYGGAFGGIAFLIWTTGQFIDLWDILRRRRLFSEDVRSALGISQPTWHQVLDFADLRRLSRTDIGHVLQVLIRDGLTGRSSDMQSHVKVLEGYLAEHRALEPFDGMPNEIKMHLERLKEQGAESEKLLKPLTAQIRDLLALKSREYSRQKLYTVGGFLLGLIGLIFAAFTYLYPPEAPIPKTTGAASPSAFAVAHDVSVAEACRLSQFPVMVLLLL